ncbi:MAG: ATP-binding cassette domain-containing protein [Polyangiaceae bacterium]|nr:ATP-binding cassette domain-containing protein [Polyangiaceae bacterium]
MASALGLRRLTKRHPGSTRAAVDGLDLEVASGEVVCLVGPSGCGKSTTLRMVAGLELPDSGDVLVDGRSIVAAPPQARDVAMVFQGFALYPHMTVREILAFPLEMRGVPRPERARRVDEALELLGLGRLATRRPAELSGGEQQRVAMGRAIVRQPRLFLFDEPLSNLDAALRAELRVELGRLLRRLGATALYVTHDQTEAMTLGARVAVLRDGRLEQVAPPREVYERPATRFVAGFFGAPPMNLLEAARCEGGARVLGQVVAAPPGPATLLLGVRPEHVRLGGASPGEIRATGTVAHVEPHGADSHVELEVGGAPLRVRVPGFSTPAPGASIELAIPIDHVRWFSADDGAAL